MIYRVTIERRTIQRQEVLVSAEDRDAADDIASEMDLEWGDEHGDDMEAIVCIEATGREG